ncbi:zinc finger protein 431-like [Watersipora subatra]|uniref:zinc finger protein 431-like n=1 Tax=Watersipora subatra TaxID=2589382 RepID=UPI00355B7E21
MHIQWNESCTMCSQTDWCHSASGFNIQEEASGSGANGGSPDGISAGTITPILFSRAPLLTIPARVYESCDVTESVTIGSVKSSVVELSMCEVEVTQATTPCGADVNNHNHRSFHSGYSSEVKLKELRICLTPCSISHDVRLSNSPKSLNSTKATVRIKTEPTEILQTDFRHDIPAYAAGVKPKELLIRLERCAYDVKQESVLIDDAMIEPAIPASFLQGVDLENLLCNQCGYSASNKTSLFTHMTKHLGDKIFWCTSCTYKAKSYHVVARHYQLRHTKYRPLKCMECSARFLLPWQLKEHTTLAHSEVKPFACNVCGKLFCKESRLNAHMKIHTGIKSYACLHCSSRFFNKSALSMHTRRVHMKERNYSCPSCDFKSFEKQTLENHQLIHTNKKPYACGMCNFATAFKGSLRDHINAHKNVRPYECKYCSMAFVRYSDRQKHISVHTGKKDYRCHLCDFSFRLRTKLNRHIKTHHTALEDRHWTEPCPFCHKKFMSEKTRKIHINRHNGITEPKLYVCDVCQRAFATRDGLRYHASVHTGEKPFKCDVCGFATRTKCLLKSHMKVHREVKDLACPECDYRTCHSWAIKCHIQTHLRTKWYTCEQCGQKFRSQGALKYHTRRVHEGQPVNNRFSCEQCDFVSASKAMLREHMFKHTGEKPFKCHICGHGTIRKWLLSQHMKRHARAK